MNILSRINFVFMMPWLPSNFIAEMYSSIAQFI